MMLVKVEYMNDCKTFNKLMKYDLCVNSKQISSPNMVNHTKISPASLKNFYFY